VKIQDLDHIFKYTEAVWEDLRGKRVFLTGGTGFFGCWLLPSFLDANARLGLGARITVLTRNAEAFAGKMPEVAADPAISFVTGDVRNFAFPDEKFDYVIHAATDASAKLNTEEPLKMIDVVAEGTRHALEFTRHCGARRFMLTSSGAVYGRLPAGMTHVSEDFMGGPDTLGHPVAYAEGKRFAEALTGIYSKTYGFESVVVRSFAVVGPYLPLDIHFAMGNFIRDGINGDPIIVGGDGTPRRSYLYGADLAIWLWVMLFRGESCRAYNMGSDEAISIGELAHLVAECFPHHVEVQIKGQPKPGQIDEWYVPSVERAKDELGLAVHVGLRDGIRRTIDWYKERLGSA